MTNYSFSVVKPHVLNFLHQHYWKIKDLMGWEDAVGEAQLQFFRTIKRLNKNGSVIENEKHLMSLFKTSWSRHFITLANKATKERFIGTMPDGKAQELAIVSLVGDQDNLGTFDVELQQAPKMVRRALLLMLNMTDEKCEELSQLFNKNKKHFNIKICQQLGVDYNQVDIVKMMLDHFGLE